ncbi:MAG: TIR domain-containing protein [Clostridia bacterium]|nr:TIR domain-containing protein [Clostridia bacterium]
MAVFKCKICGGDLNVTEDIKIIECDYCGTSQTVAAADSEKKVTLFNRANRLRMMNDFDKAAGIYESIIADFPKEAEAYWGLCLCKYGIEYVDDPATAKKIPTCHRSSFESIMDDSDFEQVMEYADAFTRKVYHDEAKQIEEIRKGIIEVSSNEEPYDIFICYKETDENGDRTIDSVIAQDVYDELTGKGYRVFFSRITLEDKLGVEYEPYIFAALNSAKIMLVFGTDYEYFNAVWVKNEWSRYLKLMANDKTKHLIPCYKGVDAYDMPKEFAKLQAQDMGKVGATQDLMRGIEKILPKSNNSVAAVQTVAASANPSVYSYLKRVFIFLADGDFKSADEYCEKVLDIDPENAQAYLGKLMAELRVCKQEELKNQPEPFDSSINYIKIKRYGDKSLVLTLEGYISYIIERNKHNHLEYIYNKATSIMSKATTETEFNQAYKEFKSISSYKNAVELAEKCDEKAERERCNRIYLSAIGLMSQNTISSYKEAISVFNQIIDWQDSKECIEICKQKIAKIEAAEEAKRIENEHQADLARKSAKRKALIKKIPVLFAVTVVIAVIVFAVVIIPASKYEKALKLVESGDYVQALAIFEELDDYKDSKNKILETNYKKAADHAKKGDYANSAICYGKAGDLSDAKRKSFEMWNKIALRDTVAAGYDHTVGLKSDGTVIAVGNNDCGQCDVTNWKNIVSVSAGSYHTVGLKSDGTVVAVGDNYRGQCGISEWTNIVAVSAGWGHTVGLKSDGTVVAVGYNNYGQCEVSEWTDIVAVLAGLSHTFGLKSDGTVVAVGGTYWDSRNVSDWTDIVAVSTGLSHTVGLKSEGTVVAVGNNGSGQCEISNWTDIVAVSANQNFTVGLKNNGTVVAVGDNYRGQCNVSSWKNIVAVSTGEYHTVGLKSNGTVIAVGNNDNGQCNVSGWKNIKQP